MDYSHKPVSTNDIIHELATQLAKTQKELEKYKRIEYRRKCIQENFNAKLKLITYIMTKIPPNNYINPTLHGSFVRQLFESVISDSNEHNINYANPINRDVDILIDCNTVTEINNQHMITGIITTLLDKLKSESNNFCELKKISNVKISYNYNSTPGKNSLVNIPRYKLLFLIKNTSTYINVDISSWKPASTSKWYNVDFDVNRLEISHKGLCSQNMSHLILWQVINSICTRKTQCLINLYKLGSHVEHTHTYKSDMLQLLYFYCERFKIIESGYTIYSPTLLPNIYIEQDEICDVTSCKPPYVVFELNCDHIITMPNLAVMISNNNFMCPTCSKLISLKFESVEYANLLENQTKVISNDCKKLVQNVLLGKSILLC